jgi:hypothetical protein
MSVVTPILRRCLIKEKIYDLITKDINEFEYDTVVMMAIMKNYSRF